VRILLLAPGVSIHSRRFLHMLLDAGHTVTLVDANDPKPGVQRAYQYIPYPGILGLEKLGLRTINRLGERWKAFQLRRIWKRVEPDVVHVHWVDSRADHCACAGLHPLVLSCWGSDINNLFAPAQNDDQYRRRIVRALAASDHVIADSPEVLERCELLAGKKLTTSLFYLGINLNQFKPGNLRGSQLLRARLDISSASRVILSPRALRPLMGHHYVLEAFSRIANSPDVPHTVLVLKRYLAYANGYEERLKLQARKLGLENRIRWLEASGNEEMPIEYTMADVVVNYPEQDGFPVTLFEAAACRRPVVTSDLRAYQPVFGEDALWTVPPANPGRLAETLKACLSEEPTAQATRLERAFQIVSERGDQRRCFAPVAKLYGNLIGL
jgi:L-malate glycosyltransferase